MRSTPRRQPTNKRKGAKDFRRIGATTKAPNLAPPPMRGGFRL
jgi:hypothetical protein